MRNSIRLLGLLCGLSLAAISIGAEEAPAAATAPPEASFEILRPGDPAELTAAAETLKSGDWRGAEEKLKVYLSKQKKSPTAWTLLGAAYAGGQKFKKAIGPCRRAVKLDPQFAPAYFWLGQAYEGWGKVDEAANEYQAAFHADPRLEAAKVAWARLKARSFTEE